ncbi:Sensor histidine kinase RcsC [Candidatus Magnetaquicoccaceae bacterium FCR-1]|uniref:histidine kinase n=1 Tax=Candidatus Magnetaquiglobus chichijimensis TaxID=3141448 RepID=A0ABQ0C7P4_9PROT
MNPLPRPRILIVDDKPANLTALRALLSRVNAEIHPALSGHEALALLVEHDFALMLLDVDMPGMDGFEVARTAFKLEQTRNLPILFLTAAYKDDFHRLQGYKSGAVDYIEKPIDDVILLSKVRLFLNLYNARNESEQLRQELHLSEERFKFALEGSTDGLWDWNIATGSVYFSPRWCAMLGYEPGEIEPNVGSWARLVHPADKAAVMARLDDHLAGRIPLYQTEHRLRTKIGEWMWVLDRGKVVARARNGTPLRAVGTHQDISPRKIMEEELRRSRENYEKLTTRIPVGVYKFRCTAQNGISFDYVSEPFCALFGLDRETLSRDVMQIFRVAHPEEQEEFLRLTLEIAKKREPFLWIGRFTVAGQVRWLHIQSTPNIELIGDTTWDGVVIDITERKALEEAMLKAKQEADTANRAKSRFLATMSHEIRTPMNTILGMGEMLRESPRLSPRERQMVQIANRAGESLMALVHDILDLSKIEAGQMQLESIPFVLEVELNQTLAIIRESATAKGIEAALSLEPGLPRQVRGDPQRLRQVLLNLLGNAIKFTHQGGIALRARQVDGGMIQFLVQDTGIGIPEDRLKEIFQPFTQGDASTPRRFGGTGLGLNICHQLVTLMGGRIWVESRMGSGSIFYVQLPLGEEQTMPEPVILSTPPEEIPLHTSDAPRLLVVDDTEDNRQVILAFLEGGNQVIVEAASGTEALERFLAEPFDLVFMDIMMPGMDGLETTRRIRAAETETGRRRTPVIAVTAHAMKEDMERSLAAGCDLHLSKPLRRGEVLEVLNRFLARGQHIPEPTQPDKSPPQVIDPVLLEQLKNETGSGFARILEMFLKNFPGRLDALRAAWETHDAEGLRQVAHKLKGTSSTFGATRFAQACAELEQLAVRQASLTLLQDALDTVLNEAGLMQRRLEILAIETHDD